MGVLIMVAVIGFLCVWLRRRRRIKKEEKRMLGYYVAPATQQIENGTSYLFFSMLEHLVSDGLHLMFFFGSHASTRRSCNLKTSRPSAMFQELDDARSGPQHDIIQHMSSSGKLLDGGRFSSTHECSSTC